MSKRQKASKPTRPSANVVVHNPRASCVRTTTPTKFGALPSPEPTTPKATPRGRQLVDGGAVKVVGPTPNPYVEGV
jgi:hypothetical protein